MKRKESLMKNWVALLTVMIIAVTFGCSKPKEEGPAEKAGKQLDQTMEKAQSSASEKMKELGKAVERAGEDLEKKK
jgi:hypothetical protein